MGRLLWAALLGMEEVLELDPEMLNEEAVNAALRCKVARILNGLDRDDLLKVQQALDAYVNRVFGIAMA